MLWQNNIHWVVSCLVFIPFLAPLSKPLNSPHKLKEPTSTPKILENTKVVKPVITKQQISEGTGKVTSKLMRETVPFQFPSRVSPKHSKQGSQSAATSHESKHITKWTVSEVGDYISSTDCFKFADLFMREVSDKSYNLVQFGLSSY